VPELEPTITPPGSASACKLTSACPAPMYLKNNEYQGKYSNIAEILPVTTDEDDFGLDAVEPLFFFPLADWTEEGGDSGFVTALKFDVEDINTDIFYFCHVHAGMSGRIKFKDAAGTMLNMEDTPAMYPNKSPKYDVVTEFDQQCGTYGLEDFQTSMMIGQCPDTFFCDGSSLFTQCIDAMNCAMLSGMTTQYGGLENSDENDVVLFLRQMIPHHRNAVNMAKTLLKNGGVSCSGEPIEEGDAVSAGCLLQPIARSIVNTQNSQIITMQDILDNLTGEEGNCFFEDGVLVDTSTTTGSPVAAPAAGPTDAVPKTSGAAGSMLNSVIATVGIAALVFC